MLVKIINSFKAANLIGRELKRKYAKGMEPKASIATTTPNMAMYSG